MSEALQTLDLNRACRVHIKRALRDHEGVPLLHALVADAQRSGPLSEKSVSVYLHEYRTIVRRLVETDLASLAEGVAAQSQIVPALQDRLDRTVSPRTSALKSTSITAKELMVLFAAIKARALADADIWLALVGLMLVSLVALGARPLELATLERSGTFLRLQNAKRSARAPTHRVFDARKVPECWIAAMLMAAEILGQNPDLDAYYRLYKTLSEILGRISLETIGRRICFYTLRHVALATWKRAGIAPADVALLAGHISVRTARLYAPASSGHAGAVVIRPVAADKVPAGVFAAGPMSAWLRPARGPRQRDWTMTLAEPVAGDLTGVGSGDPVIDSSASAAARAEAAETFSTADETGVGPTNKGERPAPARAETATPPPPIEPSADELERVYRQSMLKRGVRVVGKRWAPEAAPIDEPDPFGNADMPVPTPTRQDVSPARPAPRPQTDADRALDELIAAVQGSSRGDVALDWDLDMPRPYDDGSDLPQVNGRTGGGQRVPAPRSGPARVPTGRPVPAAESAERFDPQRDSGPDRLGRWRPGQG